VTTAAESKTLDGWLRRLSHELMRSPARTRAESLVACARAQLLTELRGRGRYSEVLARAVYDRLVGAIVRGDQ
jgi:hypothetical protein